MRILLERYFCDHAISQKFPLLLYDRTILPEHLGHDLATNTAHALQNCLILLHWHFHDLAIFPRQYLRSPAVAPTCDLVMALRFVVHDHAIDPMLVVRDLVMRFVHAKQTSERQAERDSKRSVRPRRPCARAAKDPGV